MARWRTTGVLVTANEDQRGTRENWWASARAVCANGLPGYQIVVATSPTDSSDKTVTATCPLGNTIIGIPDKQVIGSGAGISGGGGEVIIDDVIPTSNSVTASAREDLRSTNSWSVTAYALCPDPLADRQLITASTASDSSAAKTATATCPSDTQLLGTGYRTDGRAIRVTNVQPGSNTMPSNVAVTAKEERNGTTTNWSVTAFAICATP